MQKLRQIEHVTIHCALCLQTGKTVPAVTVVNSYACCETHIQLVSKPDFNIFSLRTSKGRAT